MCFSRYSHRSTLVFTWCDCRASTPGPAIRSLFLKASVQAISGASFLETTASASVGPPHVSPIMQASLGSEAAAPGLPAWRRSRLQLCSPYLPPVGFRSAEDIGLDSTAPIARRKTSALSNSAAKRSHASAKLTKVAFAEGFVACAARVRQFDACSRHSLGSPGMGTPPTGPPDFRILTLNTAKVEGSTGYQF
jgi:hypothetical protein